jgi:hypothetical protein
VSIANEKQAEAISDAFQDARGEANLATKQDLEVAFKTLEANLVRWIGVKTNPD